MKNRTKIAAFPSYQSARKWSDMLWEFMGCLAESHYAAVKGRIQNTAFRRDGYHISRCDPKFVDRLKQVYIPEKRVMYDPDGFDPKHVHAGHIPEGYAEIAEKDCMHFEPDGRDAETVIALLSSIVGEVEEQIGSFWTLANTRFTSSYPQPLNEKHWHLDGTPGAVVKILLYLTPPSLENGTTELVTREGEHKLVEGPAGTFLLFQNDSLNHRMVAPQGAQNRLMAEFTLAPALETTLDFRYGGTNSWHQWLPFDLFHDHSIHAQRFGQLSSEVMNAYALFERATGQGS